jgi:rhodanese-related sulfurtransferase
MLQVNMTSPVVEDVSLDELKRGLSDGSIALVDVREPNEWEAGHIAGAILQPLSSFAASELPRDERKRVVLHCRSGKRSVTALAIAQANGREDVRAHYGGGMLDWAAAGEPIER